jgi:hypothetical protein
MKTSRIWIAAILAITIAAGLAGCTAIIGHTAEEVRDSAKLMLPTPNLDTKSVQSIKTITINRVAVMPLIATGPQDGDPLAPGASDSVTAGLYSQVAIAGGWEVVPQEDVLAAMQKLPPTTVNNLDQNALALGRAVSADGVLYGAVDRYVERVGLDYGAASPAAVSFQLKFVELASKQVVWTAQFAKSQKALSQNLFDLVNFVRVSGRWVRAHEIALQGVQQAVANLHGNLNLQENVKRFETGTYGQIKSGSKRFDTGPAGVY